MPRLSIALLGSPQINVGGESIQVDTRKAIALLAYLVVTGERHQRDTLALLLWPELDQRKARAALRRTLSALNGTPVSPWIEAEREHIGIRRDADLWCDVHEFRQVVASPKEQPADSAVLDAAVALYRDDFMAGFSLRDSFNFDDWQFFLAEELRTAYAGILDRLVEQLIQAKAFARAILHARRRLQLDPLHEPSHRSLMQLYAWAGQRNAALRQYRACVTTLEEELGVPPLAETTALYDQIIDDQLAPPAAIAAEAIEASLPGRTRFITRQAVDGEDYPLVGRTQAWRTLCDAYASATSGGCLIVVEGEAGIGKTRLLAGLLDAVGDADAVGLSTQCYAAEREIAYGPVIALLRAGLDRIGADVWLERLPAHARAELARLLPELDDTDNALPTAALDATSATGRFFEGISHALRTLLSGDGPGLIIIDNAHWMDSATLDFLAYFLRRTQNEPVCLTLAVRSEHLRPADRIHQLMVAASQQAASFRVALHRLTTAEVSELLGEINDFPIPDRDACAQRLWRASEGLPLVLVEYLDLLRRQPELLSDDGWTLPQGVRELLQSRIRPVGEAGRQLLTAAAAIGRSFEYDLLQSVSGRSEEECVMGLEELLAFRLVQEASGLTYDFFHDQLRVLVYEETSAPRRRLLHRRIADAMTRRERVQDSDSGEIASLLAVHYLAAGMTDEAIQAHLRAAQAAAQVYANQSAIHHLEEALALGWEQSVEVRTRLGDLYMLSGDFDAARNNYDAAAARAPETLLPSLEHRLGRVHHRLGRWTQAAHHYETALADRGARLSSAERAQVLADWSMAAHRQGKHDMAMFHAKAALAAASDDDLSLARVHNLLSILTRHERGGEASLAHAGESLALAERHNDVPSLSVAAHNSLALAYAQAGILEQAIASAQAALAICRRIGDRHREAAIHNNLADFYHQLSREEQAMEHLKQAVTLFAAIGATAPDPMNVPEIWMLSEW